MARIRTIKPSFFTNDQIGALPFEWRLLFIGLWTVADREGRLKDRAMRLKATLFPYDPGVEMDGDPARGTGIGAETASRREVDVEAGLSALASLHLIQRYEADGRKLIQILEFTKHQKPHPREAASELPPPQHVTNEHHLSTARHGLGHAEPGGSGKEISGRRSQEGVPPLRGGVGQAAPRPTPQDVVTLWNAIVTPPIPTVRRITADRTRKINARLREVPDLESWRTVITWLNAQDWCRAPGRGDHANWTATLDWLTKSSATLQRQLDRALTPVDRPPARSQTLTAIQQATDAFVRRGDP